MHTPPFDCNSVRLACALLALLTITAPSHAAGQWWEDTWTGRKKVTIDTAAGGIAEQIGSAVVLVRLHDGNFSFPLAKDDGSDLRASLPHCVGSHWLSGPAISHTNG